MCKPMTKNMMGRIVLNVYGVETCRRYRVVFSTGARRWPLTHFGNAHDMSPFFGEIASSTLAIWGLLDYHERETFPITFPRLELLRMQITGMYARRTKRMLDVGLALILVLLLLLPCLMVAVLVKFTSKGPVVHWSERFGRGNALFKMPKFRTLHIGAPAVAKHLLKESNLFLTPIGKALRRSSLDELPQLLSILRGDMSFVGPRPALFNQDDLKTLRTECGIHLLNPGLTGWAQVNGRDKLPIAKKVEYELYYMHHISFLFDLKILLLTLPRVIRGFDVHD